MQQLAPLPGTGIDRRTGKVLSGWPHVLQCLDVIFTTSLGERVMREWFGSAVPKLLGRNMVPSTILKFWTAVYVAVELWEPRFKITKFDELSASRAGKFGFRLNGIYMPRALSGDFTPEGTRSLSTEL